MRKLQKKKTNLLKLNDTIINKNNNICKISITTKIVCNLFLLKYLLYINLQSRWIIEVYFKVPSSKKREDLG